MIFFCLCIYTYIYIYIYIYTSKKVLQENQEKTYPDQKGVINPLTSYPTIHSIQIYSLNQTFVSIVLCFKKYTGVVFRTKEYVFTLSLPPLA